MNYEEIYSQVTPAVKAVKSATGSAATGGKKAAADLDSGNWTDLGKVIGSLEAGIEAQKQALAALKAAYEAVDMAAYFSVGDFEKQMVEACEKEGLDVRMLDAGNYEMFPYSVKVSAERQEVTMNRKKVATVRPSYLAQVIKKGKEKLDREKFNAESFGKELAAAYDVALKMAGKAPGTAMSLSDIYKYMAPTSRAKKEYDVLSFSYDIARMYNQHFSRLKDGSVLMLGPGRGKPIRFLDANGKEQQYVTLTVQKNTMG